MEDLNKIRPPKWADDFLTWYCTPRLLEEIQGDLHEAFYKRCSELGVRKAKLRFIIDVFRSISLETLDNPFQPHNTSGTMFSSYFKSGWRNFLKYKSYSLINLFGLSIGFSAALLLLLIIRYENSFDTFHENVKEIYRVGNGYTDGNYDDLIVTPQVPMMEKEYPDITHSTRFHLSGDIFASNETYVRTTYHVVDQGFADMFRFTMIKGDLKTALASANQIVLTRSISDKLFGDEDPIGKTVRLVSEKKEFTVAAIAEDVPKNSSLQFEALIPWSNAPEYLDVSQAGNWYNTFMVGYVELTPAASPKALEEKLIAFRNTHFLEERKASWNIIFLPLAEEHSRNSKNKGMITVLEIIAGAILLISCINFTNLSVAQTLKRTREVGLRRVLGSLKMQLTIQFMIESLITCAVSMIIAVVITLIALPYVNSYYDFGATVNFRENNWVIVLLAGACLLSMLFSSAGLSIVLARVRPVNAIKGLIRSNASGEYLRRMLIVVQFTTSIILLIGTTIVWQQTNYMKSQDLKADLHNVISVDAWPELFKDPEKAKQEFLTLRNELQNESVIESVSLTSSIPGMYNENYNGFRSADSTNGEWISLRQANIDHNFFKTFDMKLVSGRNFSPDIESDKKAVIINETAMKEFGWTDIDNKEIMEGGGGTDRYKVIGVVRDYYYQSLKRSIQPLVHFFSPNSFNRLAVKINPERMEDALSLLKHKWDGLGSYEPFSYKFVDESFDTLYKEQDRLSGTSSLFSLIAVAISGMGLFSITAYSIRLRRKEISIRKVLGASVPLIIVKLSRVYGVMIIIGFVIACPIVYIMSNSFLSEFAHRIQLSPMVFVGVGISIFALAMLIVGWLSGKAALENPVDALKED